MRLINTSTYTFEEFIGRDIPPYAILSHTWETEEITYQDYTNDACRHLKGFAKVMKTLEIAEASGIRYAWVDTCCIDKRSSAELTEAINSMYLWYQRSEVCYAFLSDLEADADLQADLPHCRWFTRGWTLQEFIAPRTVYFYDCDWQYRGSKESLSTVLCQISGIERDILLHQRSLHSICVAQKMSWASSRHTTRIEDTAYSLLGLFGVNMPLLYGEEERAFLRLQEEIIKSSSDLSMLAWADSTNQGIRDHSSELSCGVLADSPAQFSMAGSIYGSLGVDYIGESSVTNRGIRLYTPLCVIKDSILMKHSYVMPLHCKSASDTELGIRLEKIGDEMFLRNDPCNLLEYDRDSSTLAPRFIYLAIRVPHALIVDNVSNQYITEKSLASLHTQVLTLDFPAPVGIYDYWGIFNHCNQTFFETSERSRGWVALRFSIYFFDRTVMGNNGIETRLSDTTIDCMLFIIGWTPDAEHTMGYYLVNVAEHTNAVTEVLRLFKSWQYDGLRAKSILDYFLPNSSSMNVHVPGSDVMYHIFMESTRVVDTTIYSRPFWKLKIHSVQTRR